jgi:PAS domain S-box-containing protein
VSVEITGGAAAHTVGTDALAGLCARLGGERQAVRGLLDLLPLGVMVFGPDRGLLFANSRAVDLCGNAEPALLDVRTERPVPVERTPLSRALRGASSEGEEFMARRIRGPGFVWLECGTHPVGDPGAESLGAVFVFRDITDRKKRESAAESANQLRDFIYHENLAGIVQTTVDGRILDCNDAILKMLGFKTREELFALRSPQIYYDPADRDRMLNLLAASGQLNKHEVCFKRSDGARCWALVNVCMLDAPSGQMGGSIVATVIDITDRKVWEETLRLSEQRFAAFMRYLPGVAFIKDLNGRYVYYNEACRTLFRKNPEDIIGRTDLDIWSREQALRYRENDAAVVVSQRPLEFVEPVAHVGAVHSWLMYKFPIVEAGQVVLVGGIGIDITERTILEEQLTQARKMDALGRLAGGVAHDFNNLLTVISGYGQMALEGVGGVPDDRMIAYLQEILNSARRASALTEQMLAFSRRQAVHPTVLDLGDLLRNMQRMLGRLIGEHVDLTVRTSREPCLIRADAHQIEQVVLNLAVNARDAMPLGGSLEIRCDRLPETLDPAEGSAEPLRILLEVRDTGIGMDEQVRPRIFDPFFTSKEKGTGLGLSMVYGVVSQSKGRIHVDSAPGEGTVFHIFLPEAGSGEGAGDDEDDDEFGEDAEAPADATPGGAETVLLVEDELSVRTLAEAILKRLGYRVLTADSGPSALEIWEDQGEHIDVLVTDVIMPQMSGGDLAQQLRSRHPGLKVLFMSGYTDDMLAGQGVLAGETQLIPKPFTPEALGRKLRDVLDA